ncbi:glycoside hydrolase, partial [Calycina marina]
PVDGPVQDLASTDIRCSFNAVPINDNGILCTVLATAGIDITFNRSGFTHSSPIFTYMAKCAPDRGSFTGSVGKVWIKVHQRGYDTVWVGQWLHDQEYKWYTVVPACLEPREYLVRYEVFGLSNCAKVRVCQSYPSCHQAKVLGIGTTYQNSNCLVSFPGTGYSGTKPGI